MITIKQVNDERLKQDIVKDVLEGLPEWFGLEASTKQYIEDAKHLQLIAASVNNKYIGFILLKETSKDTIDLYCMGIKKEYHRQNIGTLLFEFTTDLIKQKYSFIQVKTVAEGHYKEYDQTIKFYKSLGFKELEIFPTLWDEHNPCLILIKAL